MRACNSAEPAIRLAPFHSRYLVGVSSWQGDRQQGHPGVYGVLEHYARVSSYADWIDEVTGR
jgi:secreted trypsin-like serine protease